MLDVANSYREGAAARAVGRWLDRTGSRNEIVLYAKGCHPPRCTPSLVADEVDEARSLLGAEVVDVFVLHRDDPAVPVAAWAESLLGEAHRGRIASFGVSNWTLERFEALRAVLGTEARLLTTFSNHFSLATMGVPPWAGCLASSADELRQLDAAGIVALAWSAIAGGYFAGHESASWTSAENDGRRTRAQDLAGELGTSAAGVALAYVLAQTPSVLAAAGTRSEDHLEELLRAAGLQLSPDEIAFLEGRR
jgi:aryl-alcohol dehydrogenase-like predicted oxidoreductase